MPYRADLSVYPDRPTEAEHAWLSVGWLDSSHSFPQGDVPPGVVDRLRREVLEFAKNRMRGYQICALCETTSPIEISVSGVAVTLGDAEIHIESPTATFVAPTLIVHYIERHRYRPPDEFLEAAG